MDYEVVLYRKKLSAFCGIRQISLNIVRGVVPGEVI
jgi:hypothetical protein